MIEGKREREKERERERETVRAKKVREKEWHSKKERILKKYREINLAKKIERKKDG